MPQGSRRDRGVVRIVVPLAIALVALGGLAMVVALPPRKEKKVETKRPPVNVTVQVVKAIPLFDDTIDLPGVVEPDRVVKVPAEVAGRVEKIDAKEGQPVKEGQLLVGINKDTYQAQYDQAKAQLEYDRSELDRVSPLVRINVMTKKDLDLAKSRVDIGKANLETASVQLNRTRIRAPMKGVLNDVIVELGEYVKVGDPVAEIVDMEPAKVVVHVPERDIFYFKVGDSAKVEAQARGADETFKGKIGYISELADLQTRTTRTEVWVDNLRHELRSGEVTLVRLLRRQLKDVIMVPLGAVIPQEEGHAVYIAKGGKAERRRIGLGLFRGLDVQALPPKPPAGVSGPEWQGLHAGDELIVAGHRFVGPGQPVRVVNPDGAPAAAEKPSVSLRGSAGEKIDAGAPKVK